MKRRILLVDDEVAVLLTLKAVLEISGFDVDTAASAREGKSRLRTHAYDMVITDMRMERESSGEEVIAAARTAACRPAIALLTAFPVNDESWREGGADKLLVKPMQTRVLLQQIEQLFLSHEAKPASAAAGSTPAGPAVDSAHPANRNQRCGQKSGYPESTSQIRYAQPCQAARGSQVRKERRQIGEQSHKALTLPEARRNSAGSRVRRALFLRVLHDVRAQRDIDIQRLLHPTIEHPQPIPRRRLPLQRIQQITRLHDNLQGVPQVMRKLPHLVGKFLWNLLPRRRQIRRIQRVAHGCYFPDCCMRALHIAKRLQCRAAASLLDSRDCAPTLTAAPTFVTLKNDG